jgi:ABC-type polysaccharide/polyol phosphate transport system ATPase subunit
MTTVPPAEPFDEETAVCVEHVGVEFHLPEDPTRSVKQHLLHRVARRIRYRVLHALEDVSFSVSRGEVFGIIGPNGAGKSTLLKVLSRVLRPSSGRVRVRGRVAPLLGLGAGFHDELTGLENIRLNGALLGLSPEQMAERIDPIIAFSELDDFMECPLRLYSSGMRARLGFATAAALEPDVLILDEVLAVGDIAFREKCLRRIDAFRDSGVTILMVSHSLPVVHKMCRRVLWMHEGHTVQLGPAAEVAAAYEEKQLAKAGQQARPPQPREETAGGRL